MADLLTFLADYLGVDPAVLNIERQHGDYRLYSAIGDQQYIIRVSKSDGDVITDKFRSEAAIIQYVASTTSLPVPQIHGRLTDPAEPYDLLVMERMEGLSWHEAWSYLDTDKKYALVTQLAEMLDELHSQTVSGYGPLTNLQSDWIPMILKRIKLGLRLLSSYLPTSLIATISSKLENWMNIEVREPTVVHGDLNDHNLLVSSIEGLPQLSGFIDWEWGMGGMNSYDLLTIDSLLHNSPKYLSTFYRHYNHPTPSVRERKFYLLDKFVQSAVYYITTDRYTSERQYLTKFAISSLLS